MPLMDAELSDSDQEKEKGKCRKFKEARPNENAFIRVVRQGAPTHKPKF